MESLPLFTGEPEIAGFKAFKLRVNERRNGCFVFSWQINVKAY